MDNFEDFMFAWFWLPVVVIIIYFVFQIVTRDRRLLKKLTKSGVIARATVDSFAETGMVVNDHPILKIRVTAYPENRPPVQLVIKQRVSLYSIPQMQGAEVVVAYNPNKTKEAIILNQEYLDKLGYNPDTPQAKELHMLVNSLSNPNYQQQAAIAATPTDAFGKEKCRTFAEVIRVAATGQYVNGHPIQDILLKVTPGNSDSWEMALTLLAPSFAPYEFGEIVEVAYDYSNPQASLGIFSRSPDYKWDARTKFTNIRQAVYHLLAVKRSGYFVGNAEFLFIKAQAAFAGSIIVTEIVVLEPKGMRLQANMNISNFCWLENYEKKARLQAKKQGIARVGSVEITNLFWGQNPIVKLQVILENDGTQALIDEPIHVLHLPEVGKHILIAYDPATNEATSLGINT